MSRQAVSLIALAAAAPLALAQPAAAQIASFDEIVLSASRLPQAANRTGVSLSTVTTEDLERAGNLQLSDYLARLPGVGVVQNGPLGTITALRIRGAEPRYVAVYVDGIRIDDPTQPQVQSDFGGLTTGDIDRVEILRGAQSAVWGGSAVGGVINITTRRPTRDGISHSAAIEGGSRGTLAARYTLAHRDDRSESSFTLSHLRSDGFSAYDTLPPDPAREPDGTRQSRLSFSTRHLVGEGVSIGASGFVQRGFVETDGWGADRPNSQTTRQHGLRLFGEWETGNTLHMLEATHSRTRRAVVDVDWGNNDFDGSRTGFGYQGTTRVSDGFTLVYGADTMRERASYSVMPAGLSTRVSGAFLQGLWQPRADLDLSASVRYDHNSRFGSQPSGRFAVAWQVTPEVTLRGAAATGYRAPSIYELYGDTGIGLVGNPALAPEKARSFELGADWRLANGGTLGVTLFRLTTDNAITWCDDTWDPCGFALPPFGSSYENRPGATRRQGIELSASLPLGERANLGLAYTHTDARGPFGTRLLRVPRDSLTLTLDGRLAERLTGAVTLRHAAGRVEFPASDSYTVVNAGLSWELATDTHLSLRVENLLDRKYQTVPDYGTAGRSVHIGLKREF